MCENGTKKTNVLWLFTRNECDPVAARPMCIVVVCTVRFDPVIAVSCTYSIIYYINLQCPFVCLSVLSTRLSDRNQIWHTYSGRYGIHSQLNKMDPPHHTGNITSFVTALNVEHARHLKTTTRRSMILNYVMSAVWGGHLEARS